MLKLCRVLNGWSLSTVASQVKSWKGYLSEVERDPARCSPAIKRRLEKHFGAPWSVLAATIDTSKLSRTLVSKISQEAA